MDNMARFYKFRIDQVSDELIPPSLFSMQQIVCTKPLIIVTTLSYVEVYIFLARYNPRS
jgi:hypothetical protein